MPSPRLTIYKVAQTALAAWVLGLAGCSNNARLPDNHHFNTLITPQGLKLFELALPSPTYRLLIPSSARGTPSRNTQQDTSYSEKQIENLVEKAIETTHYCRSGFYLLGRYAGETAARIRGECRESASNKDRKTFPNTLHAW